MTFSNFCHILLVNTRRCRPLEPSQSLPTTYRAIHGTWGKVGQLNFIIILLLFIYSINIYWVATKNQLLHLLLRLQCLNKELLEANKGIKHRIFWKTSICYYARKVQVEEIIAKSWMNEMAWLMLATVNSWLALPGKEGEMDSH